MTSVTTSDRESKARESKARELVAEHLSNRAAHGIVARMTREGVGVFIVADHVVTLKGVGGAALDTCDCGDMMHRRPVHGCKHIQAARLVASKPALKPASAPVGITNDPAAVVARRARRTEPVEEV